MEIKLRKQDWGHTKSCFDCPHSKSETTEISLTSEPVKKVTTAQELIGKKFAIYCEKGRRTVHSGVFSEDIREKTKAPNDCWQYSD